MKEKHMLKRESRRPRAGNPLVTRALGVLLVACALAAVPLAAESTVVNVNSAEASELSLLPKVGPSIANRIVEYREQNGRFKSAEELMLIRGIGEKTFVLLSPYVTLTGNTTLQEKVSVPKTVESEGDG